MGMDVWYELMIEELSRLAVAAAKPPSVDAEPERARAERPEREVTERPEPAR